MAKIKLKITHIINDEEVVSYLMGIRNNNKITYLDDDCTIILEKFDNRLMIVRIKDYENHMIFGDDSYGYLIIDGQKINYQIRTDNISISDNRIEISYFIEESKKYILEVLND